jgi:heterodisulfide reductase subunit B
MSIESEISWLKAHIIDTERLLKMCAGHKLMSNGLKERLEMLKQKLASLQNQNDNHGGTIES